MRFVPLEVRNPGNASLNFFQFPIFFQCPFLRRRPCERAGWYRWKGIQMRNKVAGIATIDVCFFFQVQATSFEFFLEGKQLSLAGVSAKNVRFAPSPKNEGPQNLVDGSYFTKWLTFCRTYHYDFFGGK